MKRRHLLFVILLLPLAACTLQVGEGRSYAPPHYAPPPSVEWRWDPALDVYVILGAPHLYYRDRIYYRWHDDGWYWSDRRDGGWNKGRRHMPPGLQKKYGKPRRSHGGGGY